MQIERDLPALIQRIMVNELSLFIRQLNRKMLKYEHAAAALVVFQTNDKAKYHQINILEKELFLRVQ